jgi:hypothetical protein
LDRAVIESDCRRLATEWQWSTIVRTIASTLGCSEKEPWSAVVALQAEKRKMPLTDR